MILKNVDLFYNVASRPEKANIISMR